MKFIQINNIAKRMIVFVLFLLVLVPFLNAQNIWIETEGFQNKGGWVVDPQFMDVMGSPYLLAHGKGIPVADASTEITVSEKGTYQVWIRTFNWNSPWDSQQAPGIFQLLIDGKTLGGTLGKSPEHWGWVKVGSTLLQKANHKISLHDLSGFEGRCDALFFTKDETLVPPDAGDKLKRFREQYLDLSNSLKGEKFDLVVVGGGVAGLCAAVSASRMGLKTALVHNRPMVGGNNSPEIKVGISGGFNLEPYPNIGNVISELGNAYTNQERIMSILKQEKNLSLFLNSNAFDVEMKELQIVAVLLKNIETNTVTRLETTLVADCTGDGNVGFAAGADYKMGRETRSEYGETLAPEVADNFGYGSSLKWDSKESSKETHFPVLPWAVQFSEATVQYTKYSDWTWETGFHYNQIIDFEYIRDYALRVTYGNWSYLKNFSKRKEEYKNTELNYVAYVPGKRESRRLLGDVVFTQQDAEGEWTKYNDACVKGTYSLDQHFPEPENTVFFPGEEFRSTQKHNLNPLGVSRKNLKDEDVNSPYMIPYRCLYSRNISNLFMAGRDISTTRIAMTSSRVQGTTGMMGEVVGIAAYLCMVNECTPREIYEKHLDEFKEALQNGIPRMNPPVLKPSLH